MIYLHLMSWFSRWTYCHLLIESGLSVFRVARCLCVAPFAKQCRLKFANCNTCHGIYHHCGYMFWLITWQEKVCESNLYLVLKFLTDNLKSSLPHVVEIFYSKDTCILLQFLIRKISGHWYVPWLNFLLKEIY